MHNEIKLKTETITEEEEETNKKKIIEEKNR